MRLIDADALFVEIEKEYKNANGMRRRGLSEALDSIADTPTIDAVPVVRCQIRSEFGLGDPKTNADHIRSMTDEELANYLVQAVLQQCPCPTKDCEAICNDCILHWLKQPYREEV